MSTGYSWEGIRQVCAALLWVPCTRAPLRFVTWGAISSALPLPSPLPLPFTFMASWSLYTVTSALQRVAYSRLHCLCISVSLYDVFVLVVIYWRCLIAAVIVELNATYWYSCLNTLEPRTTLHIYTFHSYYLTTRLGVPRWQSHRRSGLATLPSVGAVP